MNIKSKHVISLILSAVLLASPVIGVSAYSGSEGVNAYKANGDTLTVCEDAVALYASGSADYADVTEYLAYNILNFEKDINIYSYNINSDELYSLFVSLTYDHPELINIYNSYSYTSYSNGRIYSFSPNYVFSKAEKDYYFVPFYEAIDNIAAQAEKLPNDFSKVLFVHDYLASNCEYATEIYDSSSSVDYFVYNAYGCLVNHRSVCQGYSFSFKAIMDKLGIEVGYAVSETESMNHLWNTVTVDGRSYHIDVTYDDPIYDKLGRVSHDNFLCTDAEITATDHYDWTASQEITSEPYQDRFWDNINSKICFDGEYMYYADYDSTAYAHLEKRNISTGETEIIPSELTGTRWTTVGGNSYYVGNFSRIELADGKIYYSLPDGVNAINIDGSGDTRRYTLPEGAEGRLYGFAVKSDGFYGQICATPNEDTAAVLLIQPEQTESSEPQPVQTESSETQPTETESSEPQPTVTELSETQPTSTQAIVTEPSEIQPTSTQAIVTEPPETQPTSTQAIVTEPSETQPTSTQKIVTEPSESQPETTEPGENPGIIIGDVNRDGILDINDVTYLQMHLASYKGADGKALIDEEDSVSFAVADFNGDGSIDINDVTAIQMRLAGYYI